MNQKKRIKVSRELLKREAYRETYVDIEEKRSIANQDQERIDKKYNSKRFPNLRRVGDYLRKKFMEGKNELNKKQISKDLEIKMGSLNGYLSELNRYMKFQPMRWINVQGKKDFIEVAGNDFDNSITYLKKTIKGLTSRTTRFIQTKEKIQEKHEEEEVEKYKNKLKTKAKEHVLTTQ